MRIVIVASLLMSVATSALADWQRTKWGMTENQVKAAMAGPSFTWTEGCIVGAPPNAARYSMHITYKAGEFDFQGCLEGSTEKGLDKVGLLLKAGANPAGAADNLQHALEAKYGAAFRDETHGILGDMEWHSGNNRVVLTRFMSTFGSPEYVVMLNYTPLASASSNGL